MRLVCPTCHRSWEEPATFCGACGAALDVRGASRPPGGRWRAQLVPTAVTVGLAVAVAVGLVVGVGRTDGSAPVPVPVDDDRVDLGPTFADATTSVRDEAPDVRATCEEGDPDGCVRWTQPAGVLPRSDGPVLVVGRTGDRVAGLDPDTGHPRWTAAASPPLAPPLVLEDGSVLVEDATGVRALDADDGDVRWRADGQHLPATAPDQIQQDVVVLDDLAGELTGVGLADGIARWTVDTGIASNSPAVVVPMSPERSFVATPDGLRVVEMTTGREVWAAGQAPHDAEVPLAVTPDHVVTVTAPAGDESSPVLRIRRTDGRLTAEVSRDQDLLFREVAITGSHLLLRTPTSLDAHRLDDGSLAWRRADLPGRLVAARPVPFPVPFGTPAGRAGLASIATRSFDVVVMHTDGTSTMLEARTGREVRRLGEPSPDGVRISRGFLTSTQLWRIDRRSVEVHDLSTGRRVLRVEVLAPPTVVRTAPAVISTAGRLVGLDSQVR